MTKVEHLSKMYRVHTREPGFSASLKSLFNRASLTKCMQWMISALKSPRGKLLVFSVRMGQVKKRR
jgi:ABC-type uncharacterized transport system ATPase subunit